MVNHMRQGTLARKHLDEVLALYQAAAGQPRPPRGWVRAIRDALGMSSRQLAARMGLKQPTITALEKSEEMETVSLKTLRQAAEALNCQLVYALVPKATLEETVKARARELADEHLARAHHTMRLENQALRARDLAEERERIAQSLLQGRASRLWEGP
jgi:predicted DNA-binding mobile mystery protein A